MDSEKYFAGAYSAEVLRSPRIEVYSARNFALPYGAMFKHRSDLNIWNTKKADTAQTAALYICCRVIAIWPPWDQQKRGTKPILWVLFIERQEGVVLIADFFVMTSPQLRTGESNYRRKSQLEDTLIKSLSRGLRTWETLLSSSPSPRLIDAEILQVSGR